MVPLGEGRFFLPDETERYLVDERRLVDAAARLGALQLDPIKTTVVQGLRAMTTWRPGRAMSAGASGRPPPPDQEPIALRTGSRRP